MVMHKNVKSNILVVFVMAFSLASFLMGEKKVSIKEINKVRLELNSYDVKIIGVKTDNYIFLKGETQNLEFNKNKEELIIKYFKNISDKSKKLTIFLPSKVELQIFLFSGRIAIKDFSNKIFLNSYNCNFSYNGDTFSGFIRIRNGQINVRTRRVVGETVLKTESGNIRLNLLEHGNLSLIMKTNFGTFDVNKKYLLKYMKVVNGVFPMKKLIYDFPGTRKSFLKMLSTYGDIVLII